MKNNSFNFLFLETQIEIEQIVMKIAILGTRGVPNYYGGFEQFAEFFSVYLVEQGHEVYVYNSHNHPYQEKTFHGVNIIHQKDPEHKMGTFGQFIYDYNCILDSKKRDFDIILQLGYTSNSIWFFLLPKKPIIITNMDGLEWKRTKYSRPVKQFLKFAERLAAVNSDYLISDSLGIKKYLAEKYAGHMVINIYGDNVAMILWGKKPFAIVIEQEEFALGYRKYFDLLWKIAKK